MTQLRVSVLTPSYNQARWLADNLRSVAVQSYPIIEHIVMDGGSTDGSRDILASASPAVVWESGPDEGQSDAINKAFHRSTGEIIGWLNSDDAYFSRDVVARAVEVFEKHPEIGLVYGHAVLVNTEGTILQVIWASPFAHAGIRAFDFISQPTVFVRRSALGRPDLVDPALEYAMDWELWLHLARRTRFHRLNRVVALGRHHLQRKSYTRPDLATHDTDLLKKRYGRPRLASILVVHKGMNAVLRMSGLSKVREAARGGDALGLTASARSLAFRQIAQLRRWMPAEDK